MLLVIKGDRTYTGKKYIDTYFTILLIFLLS